MKNTVRWLALSAAIALAVPMAVAQSAKKPVKAAVDPNEAVYDLMTAEAIKAGFRDQGIAKKTRLTETDPVIRECSLAAATGRPLSDKRIKELEAEEMKKIKWPSDGRYLGDWREGEKIAQSGRGMTWTDDARVVNGGNCYNCHQIDKAEISHGTLGPSLWNFGKLRGVTDPNSPAAQAMVRYTWGKIYNAKAYNACSNMPRAGVMGVLTEDQIRHIVALLLDPKSPVNQ